MLFAFSIILSFSALSIFANPTPYSNEVLDAEDLESTENQDGFIVSQNTEQIDPDCDSTYTYHVTCGGPLIRNPGSEYTILNCVSSRFYNLFMITKNL